MNTYELTAKTGRKVLAKSPGLTEEEVNKMTGRVLVAHRDKPELRIEIKAETAEEVTQ